MILPQYQDKDGYWYGTYLQALSVGYNEKRFKEEFEPKGVKAPETLDDSLKPEFKGEVIMPDPENPEQAIHSSAPFFSPWAKKKAGPI